MVAMLRVREQHAGSLSCPQCGSDLVAASPDWWRCFAERCSYELTADAYSLYATLSELFDRDPDAFFQVVQAHRDELRALEPAWMR